jgi:predicted outer membrane repeat protein
VTIQGNGATIEQTCDARVLNTQFAITLENVTITGGNVDGPGGGLLSDSTEDVVLTGATFTGNTASDSGGGVAAAGNLTVTGSTFSDNHDTGGDGGAIKVFAATGTTTIDGSTFASNSTVGWGGAFEQQGVNPVAAAGTKYSLTVTNSTFTGNVADGDGGGALDTEDPATMNVSSSTFTGNQGGWGGAVGTFGNDTTLQVFASTFDGNASLETGGAVEMSAEELAPATVGSDVATFVDSTITGNTQGADGALNIDGTLNLGYVTITDNTSTGGGAKSAGRRGARAQFTGQNNAANITAEALLAFGSVVALPNGGPNCETIQATVDRGYQFSDDASCGFTNATSKVATPNDPVLGALANNGGPTETPLPLAGSPLLDAIPPSVCSEVGIDVDQRGVTRPQGTGCDIGAVEVEVVAPAAIVVTPKFTG